jgi:hypothetical protein
LSHQALSMSVDQKELDAAHYYVEF